MSIESFSGFDANEEMSQASFEAFKEKMKRAAAQIAAIKKEEKKQKQKEDELVKLLLKYIKSSHNKQLVLLISRVLEKNIPASFILIMIYLGDDELQAEVEKLNLLSPKDPDSNEKNLAFFQEEQTFSLENRLELDRWIKGILNQAGECAPKLLKNAYEYIDDKKITSTVLVDLFVYVMTNYFEKNKINFNQEGIINFAKLVLKNLLDRTEQEHENRKKLD